MEKINVFDGALAAYATVQIERTSAGGVRFISDPGGGQCFHIADPKSAKRLRELLKPLADLA